MNLFAKAWGKLANAWRQWLGGSQETPSGTRELTIEKCFDERWRDEKSDRAVEQEQTASTGLSWDVVFAALDRVLLVRDYRWHMHGAHQNGLLSMARKIGSYIDSAEWDDLPRQVEYVKEMGIPAFICACPLVPKAFDDAVQARKIVVSEICLQKIDYRFSGPAIKAQIEKPDGELFECAILYVAPKRQKRWGKEKPGRVHGMHFFCSINTEGRVRILDENGKPSRLLLWHASNGGSLEEARDFNEGLIAQAVNSFRKRDMHWQVHVKRGDKGRACVGINPLDAPKLFNDRIKVKSNGRTKPIFHAVRAHHRTTKSGKTIVPIHHRGVRDFDWRGYHCQVRIPFKDNPMMSHFTLGSIEETDDEAFNKTMITAEEAYEFVAKADEMSRKVDAKAVKQSRAQMN